MSDFYDKASEFLKKYESFTPKATWDVNAYRIGHGSDTLTLNDGTYRKVKKGDTTTKELAAKDLARRIKKEFEPRLINQITEKAYNNLPDPAKIALISLSYNYGSITHPEIILAAKTGDVDLLAKSIVESTINDNKGTKYYNGLRKRRKAEADYAKSIKGKSIFTFQNNSESSFNLKQTFFTALVVVTSYFLYTKIKK